MAFSGVAARGSITASSFGSTLVLNPSANIVAGKIAFISVTTDNLAIVDGNTTNHSISDSKGNTWNKVFEVTDTDGAVNDGITVSLWWSKVGTDILTTDSVTLTLTGSMNDRTISLGEATIGTGNTLAFYTGYTPSASGTSLAHTLSSLPSREYFLLGLFGSEGEDSSKTPEPGYTEAFDLISSTSGAADVNNQQHVQVKIATLTGDTVASTTVTYTNGIQSLTAFYEVSSGPVTYDESVSIGSVNSIESNGQLITDVLSSISGDNQVLSSGSLVINESGLLESIHLVGSIALLTINEALSLLSDNQIQAGGNLIINLVSTLLSDNQISLIGNMTVQDFTTLLSEGDLSTPLGTIFDEFVNISSSNELQSIVSIIINELANIASIHEIQDSATAVFENQISLNSSHGISAIHLLILDLASSVSSTHQISSEAILIIEGAINLLSDIDSLSLNLSTLDLYSALEALHQLQVIIEEINTSETFDDTFDDTFTTSYYDTFDNTFDDTFTQVNIYNESVAINAILQLEAIISLLIEEMISVSSVHQSESSGSLIINSSVEVDAGADASNQPISTIIGTLQLISEHLLSVLDEAPGEESILLSLISSLGSGSQITLNELILLSTANDLQALAETIKVINSTIDASGQVVSNSFIEFIQALSISGISQVSAESIFEYLNSISISVEMSDAYLINAEINNSLQLLVNATLTVVDEAGEISVYDEYVSIQAIVGLLVSSYVSTGTLRIIGVSIIKGIDKLK